MELARPHQVGLTLWLVRKVLQPGTGTSLRGVAHARMDCMESPNQRPRERRLAAGLGALAFAAITGTLTASCENVSAAERTAVSPFRIELPIPSEPQPLGKFRITYYYVAHEASHESLDAQEIGIASGDNEFADLASDNRVAAVESAPEPAVSEAPVGGGGAPALQATAGDIAEADAPPSEQESMPDESGAAEPSQAELAGAFAGREDGGANLDGIEIGDDTAFTPARPSGGAKRAIGFVTLYDHKTCKPLATVNRNFATQIAMQGTGQLNDGRLINYVGACGCANSPCFQQVSARAKWGTGAAMKALTPFRSIAVDPAVIKLGTRLYIPELDGQKMPGKAPWGGFVHDGCVVAEDTGGAIDGLHIDFFVAGKQHYYKIDRKLKLKEVTIYDGSQKCAAKPSRLAATVALHHP